MTGDRSGNTDESVKPTGGIEGGPHDGSAATWPRPHEVGSWSLDYLGPGFHAQIRIAHHAGGALVGGWTSPPLTGLVVLVPLTRRPVVRETVLSDSGRFEFLDPPTGPCRLTFVPSKAENASVTPPFWI